jgi:hypothetical protein
VFRGDSPAARFWSLTWLQTRERLVAAATEGDLVDRGRDVLTDRPRWFYGSAMVILGAPTLTANGGTATPAGSSSLI